MRGHLFESVTSIMEGSPADTMLLAARRVLCEVTNMAMLYEDPAAALGDLTARIHAIRDSL